MKIILSGLPPKDFVSEISSHLNIKDDPTVHYLRSADPPSVIQIVGSVVEWLDLYKVVSIVFVSTITKEIAKDLYKNKGKILHALGQATVKPLKAFVDLIIRNKERIDKEKIHLIFSLNIPDEIMGTNLQLQGASEEELAWQFANFIIRLEKIEGELNNLISSAKPPLFPVSLLSQDDGSIIIKYMDKVDLELHELKIE
jgi:hypothetical protein